MEKENMFKKEPSKDTLTHEQVVDIRRLIFSVTEDTLDSLRQATIISFTWKDDGKKSTYAIKNRLIELVGTDEIRLNDRTYIDKLVAALDREYEKDQIKKEQRLKEAEQNRLRKIAEEEQQIIKDKAYVDALKVNING